MRFELLPELESTAHDQMPPFERQPIMRDFGLHGCRLGEVRHTLTQVFLFHRYFLHDITPKASR
jgi:hypothetical protein